MVLTDFTRVNEFHLKDADKTIWLFGAGASRSKPYNVPVQNGLLESFERMNPAGKEGAKRNFNELRERVKNACQQILPGASLGEVTLEEVFSAYEIQSETGWTTEEEKKSAEKTIHDLRRMLIRITGIKGKGNAHKFMPHKRGERFSPYAELLEKLFPAKCQDNVAKSHVLVTMNYDINLDRCLINMRQSACGEIDLDYGIELANYRFSGGFKRPRSRSVLLLRLHGGLNWKRCLACQAVFTTVSSHAHFFPRETCRLCGSERLDYVIMHPSFTRQYKDPVLQIIWGRLLEELSSADRWVFIGYSLPPADIHLRELLRQALKMRSAASKEIKILWVGWRKNDQDEQWLALGMRYKHLFGDRANAWENAEDGFSGFVHAMKI